MKTISTILFLIALICNSNSLNIFNIQTNLTSLWSWSSFNWEAPLNVYVTGALTSAILIFYYPGYSLTYTCNSVSVPAFSFIIGDDFYDIGVESNYSLPKSSLQFANLACNIQSSMNSEIYIFKAVNLHASLYIASLDDEYGMLLANGTISPDDFNVKASPFTCNFTELCFKGQVEMNNYTLHNSYLDAASGTSLLVLSKHATNYNIKRYKPGSYTCGTKFSGGFPSPFTQKICNSNSSNAYLPDFEEIFFDNGKVYYGGYDDVAGKVNWNILSSPIILITSLVILTINFVFAIIQRCKHNNT